MIIIADNFEFDNVIPFKNRNIPPKGKSTLTVEQSEALEKRLMPQIKAAVKQLKIEMKALGYDRT